MKPKEAVKRLKEAVKKKGEDFKYADHFGGDSCLYFYSNRPACIIGVAFEKEITAEFKRRKVALNDPTTNVLGVHNLLRIFPDDTLAILSTAQQYQDDGLTWGEVLKEAKSRLEKEK